MSLTSAQQAILRAAIQNSGVWNAFPNTDDGNIALAAALNSVAAPDFIVWRTDTPVTAIVDAIDLSKYTPNDAADGTAIYTNRSLASQTKQMNLQLMLQGRDRLNTSLVTVRAGLRDAVIQVPTGVGGALTAPGGASGITVLTACTRKGTEAEKILATASQGSDTTGSVTARVMGFEGTLSYQDVASARAV